MDDLQILLKAVIDENSQSSLDSKLASIAKSLSESHTVKLKVGFDEDSVKTVQSQLQTIAKQVGGANHTGTYKPLQVFDATQLTLHQSKISLVGRRLNSVSLARRILRMSLRILRETSKVSLPALLRLMAL